MKYEGKRSQPFHFPKLGIYIYITKKNFKTDTKLSNKGYNLYNGIKHKKNSRVRANKANPRKGILEK